MNPADIAPSVAPLASSNLSLFHLFWHAHWIVEVGDGRAAGLLGLGLGDRDRQDAVCSRGFAAPATSFEQAFWSGQSLEELYKSLVGAAEHSTGGAVRRRDAGMEAQPRGPCALVRRPADAHREGDERRHRARGRAAWSGGSWCWRRSARRAPSSACSAPSAGIMTSFQSIAASKNTSLAVVAPGIAEALFATAIGLVAAIPATIFYNKFIQRGEPAGAAAGGFCRRVHRDPVAADRRARAEGTRVWRRASMGAASGGGRRSAAAGAVMSDINVTPFVDVMLVLLDRLHGLGAAADGRRADRPAAEPGQGARSGQRAADAFRSTSTARSSCRTARSSSTIWCRSSRRSPRPAAAPDDAHLCARRQEGRLRYHDAGDGTAFGGRLPPRWRW